MHEFSIAIALLELAQRHLPPGATLQSARVEAGALRGIDPDALTFGWQQATLGTACEGSVLHITILPWHLVCPQCQKEWESNELYVTCACGCETPHPRGSDELRLLSMEVEEPTSEPRTLNPSLNSQFAIRNPQ